MFNPKITSIPYLVLSGFLLVSSPLAHSGSLPKSTTEMLKRNKLDPAILADIDKELRVPQQWIDQAKKEGKLRIRGTSDAARRPAKYAPFRERYPFIDLDVMGSSHESRVVKTLIAYKSGRVIGDVVDSPGKNLERFKELNALQDVRDIPALRNVIPEARDPEGLWIAHGANTYCMAYNTRAVQRKDLPNQWEDLLVNPVWKNGNLAVANRPERWALSLWKAKGETQTKEFLARLFAEVKPQHRKEGLNAMSQLLAAGEFHAVIPASNSTIYRVAQEGAPINFWCPEPASFVLSITLALRGPNIYATKLYLNWMVSKEGQIAQQIDNSGTPIHSELQSKAFFPYADHILARQKIFMSISDEQRLMPKLTTFWNNLWLRGAKR